MSSGTGAATASAVPHRLGHRTISLGAANVIDYAMQFLLPVVLVRYLTPEAFGSYRLLWLVAGTVMAVVTQAMAAGLFYFLPRSGDEEKRLYINQALLYLSAAGLIAACAVSGWNPWLPQNVRELSSNGALLPTFVMFWVVSSLLDLIGSTEERVRWQTRTIVGLSALRAVALSAAAVLTRQLEPVLLTLLGFAIFKFALLLTYVARYHGLKGPFLRRRAFTRQLRQTAPFAFTGALYGLRAQADQWVATALFSVGMFASFSIAALLSPLVHLCRVSVQQAFLPSISRLEAAGDLRGMLELNSRGSVLAATLLYPVLVFAFVFSAEIVTIIYTSAYVAAAPVMRIYILGLIALVIEPATLMLLLRQGAFSMRLGVLALALSVGLSWTCACAGGLAGAAVGSVTAIYLDHVGTLWRISRCTGIRWRHLQDWRSLGLLLLCASLAGVISWAVVSRVPAGFGPEVRVAAGGVLLAVAYLALIAMCRLARRLRGPAAQAMRREAVSGGAARCD